MAAKYWLKLYHEMLDDRKVARLPDSSYRRFIECLLLAGELDEGGYLPQIPDMAWRLRVDDETLTQDLSRLATAELVEIKENGRWFVTSFEKRQKGLSKAEYMKRLRDERRVTFQEENEDVTISNADSYQPVTNSKTDKIRLDTDKIRLDGDDTISLFISAITKISSTPYWAKTENEYEDIAFYLHGKDATIEQIEKFGEWWKQNSYYDDDNKATLKSIIGSWDNFVAGKTAKPKGKQVDVSEDVKGFMTGSKSYKDLSPPAQAFVKAHGGNDLKQIRPNSFEDNQIKKEAASYVQ